MNSLQWLWFLACASIFVLSSTILYHAAPSKEAHFDRDSYGYVTIAQHFAQTSKLVNPHSNEMPVQTVGYPFFVGMLYKLFGMHTWVIVLAQILLSILAGLLTMKIALLLFGSLAGYISAFLWSVCLGFVVYSQFYMTEILLVTLLLACIYNFLVYMYATSVKNLYLAALFAGISVAVKPVALLYILGLCFCMLVWGQGTTLKRTKATALFCIIFAMPVAGYMTFNKITHNSFAVSSLVNENLYVYFLSKLTVHTEGVSYSSAMQNILTSFEGYSRTDPERWNTVRQQFWNHVYSNPLLVAKIWAGNTAKTLLGLFSTQLKLFIEPTVEGGDCSFSNTKGSIFERIKQYVFGNTTSKTVQAIAFAETIWNIFRYLLVALALCLLLVARQYFLCCFFVGSIFYFSIITGHDGCGRYRMMFEPLLIVLASYAISVLYVKIKETMRPLWKKIPS